MKIRLLATVIFVSFALDACGPAAEQGQQETKNTPDTQQTAAETNKEAVRQQTEEPGKAAVPDLKDPSTLNLKAPDKFKIKLDTTKGTAVIEVYRDWSPKGADRIYNLAKAGFFKDIAFFRVIKGFMAQFGIYGDPAVSLVWRGAEIADDPVKNTNERGTVSFAMAGPDTRTTQLFINFNNNSFLDQQGFSPVGKVTEGMDVIDSLYAGYGEGAPQGTGPSQAELQERGNKYLKTSFPKLDYINSAEIEE